MGGHPTLGTPVDRSELRISPSRILACHPWDSRIRPCPYRPLEFVIPGTTDAADEMARHIRHRQPLRQSERLWLNVDVTGWPAGRAFDLEEFAVPCEITDRHWLDPERLGLATAAGPVPIALQLDKLGQTSEQSGDCLSLNVGQPLVRDGAGIPRQVGQGDPRSRDQSKLVV
jgi:hypothetical protein